jgi:hypothetical protein
MYLIQHGSLSVLVSVSNVSLWCVDVSASVHFLCWLVVMELISEARYLWQCISRSLINDSIRDEKACSTRGPVGGSLRMQRVTNGVL